MALAFLMTGIALAILLIVHIWQGILATMWPTTPGRVIQVEVNKDRDFEAGDVARVRVTFLYSVDGIEYIGNRLGTQPISTDPDAANALAAWLGNAEEVVVYYHPRRPAVSMLFPGVNWLTLFGALVVPAVFIAGYLAFR